MKYLLDTCTVSYIINGKFPSVQANFAQHKHDDMAISAITHAELMYGIKKKGISIKVKQAIMTFCSTITILPFTYACAEMYSDMRSNNEKAGLSLSAFDGLIAAHALAEKRTLITKDKAFKKIKELAVEDWS